MSWRYQPVWRDDPASGRSYSLCEVYLDRHGRLDHWTECAAIPASGEDLGDLIGDLRHMLEDAEEWEPVRFASLMVGMRFKRRERTHSRASTEEIDQ